MCHYIKSYKHLFLPFSQSSGSQICIWVLRLNPLVTWTLKNLIVCFLFKILSKLHAGRGV